MKSKGFKILVAALALVIVVLAGLLAAKMLIPAAGSEAEGQGGSVPEGALEDTTITPSPSGGYDIATPKDGEDA